MKGSKYDWRINESSSPSHWWWLRFRRAIAEKYAKNGAKVVILGRHENTLQETAKTNDNISYVVADLTKDEDITKVANYIKDNFGHLNILVNNDGWCPIKPLAERMIADYDRIKWNRRC